MEYQYDSRVRQEPGVTIDDDTGVSWWSHDITNESQPWLETTFVWMTCLRNAILGVKKGGSRSMTTLESAWRSPQTSPDILYNISSHSGQLSLKKYCRKSALAACSPLFSPSGTWASTTTSMRSGSVLTPSSWSSAMSWGLAVGSRSLQSIILTQEGSKHC